jgi:hypothetical protein
MSLKLPQTKDALAAGADLIDVKDPAKGALAASDPPFAATQPGSGRELWRTDGTLRDLETAALLRGSPAMAKS